MANKITVQFEAKGAGTLKTAIDKLNTSQAKLEKNTHRATGSTKKLNDEGRWLVGTKY